MRVVTMTWLVQADKENTAKLKHDMSRLYSQLGKVWGDYGEVRGGEFSVHNYNPHRELFVQPKPRVHLAAPRLHMITESGLKPLQHYEALALCGPKSKKRVQTDPTKVTCRICLKKIEESST